MLLNVRQSQVLTLLREHGSLSRWELHEHTGLRPNTIGNLVAVMIREGLIREGVSQTNGPGRPRVPLEIDPERRCVVGLALRPGELEMGVLNLRGEPVGPVIRRRIVRAERMGPIARALYLGAAYRDPLAVGISMPGLVDPQTHSILLSSTSPGGKTAVNLEPIYHAVGDTPIVLDNDMHALAAHWVFAHQSPPREDVMLVYIRDGALGSAVLVDGRPNHGCVVGANELGHTRFFVDTELCYCGQRGCLERICSSAFLRARGMSASITLAQAVRDFPATNTGPLQVLLRYLAAGLANAVNFIRPARLVLTGPLMRPSAFTAALTESIRALLLAGLLDRIHIDLWDESPAGYAQAAAWLAIAPIFLPGWQSPLPTADTPAST